MQIKKFVFGLVIIFLLFILEAVGFYFVFNINKNENVTKEKFVEKNIHYSYWATDDFFQKAFDSARLIDPPNGLNIQGVIVNHHLLAPQFVARSISMASFQKYSVIVLISPNHFQIGKKQVLTSTYDWMTPFGLIKKDNELSNKLGLIADEVPFDQEHGIKNILPFIKYYFPDTPVIPIIIKDIISDKNIDSLADNLNANLPENVLVIASFDFSHNKTSNIADQNDEISLGHLKNLDYNTTGLDIDSTKGLRLFLKLMTLRQADSFGLLDHSNAGKLLKNPEMENVTSYITGYFSK